MRIDEALLDQNVLGAGLGNPEPWAGWLAIHKAAAGVELTESEASFFEAVSGGRKAPLAPVKELIVDPVAGAARAARAALYVSTRRAWLVIG